MAVVLARGFKPSGTCDFDMKRRIALSTGN